MRAMLMMLQVAAMGAEAPPMAEIEPSPGAWAREAAGPSKIKAAAMAASLSFRDCMQGHGIAWAAGSDSAEIVARAARARCEQEEAAVRATMLKYFEEQDGRPLTENERAGALIALKNSAAKAEKDVLILVVERRAQSK